MRSVAAALLLGLLAGCSGAPASPVAADDGSAPSPAPSLPADEVVTLYSFAGMLTGVALPSPQGGPGAAVPVLPLALEESFEVPGGVLQVDFVATQSGGAGSARVEIVDPEGATVYRSLTWDGAGSEDVVYAGVAWQSEMEADDVPPGRYSVRFYVAGTRTLEVDATAKVASEPATAATAL